MTDYSYDNLKRALDNLERHQNNLRNSQDSGDDLQYQRDMQMLLIKSFELCYATLLKALHRKLTDGGILNLSEISMEIIKTADRSNFLDNGDDYWLKYVQARNTTSHEYNEEQILEVLRLMPDFHKDTTEVYKAITERK